MIKLSIIIPAYNAEPYIHELISCLEPQVVGRDDVQVIVIDDGSKKPLKLNKPWIEFYSSKTNKGASNARNKGLKKAKGEYIQFIDADDLVADNFVEYVIEKIDSEHFDYMLLSWKSLPGGINFDFKLNNIHNELPPMNVSSVTRTFKRSFIGDQGFNENKIAAEDEEFTRHLDFAHGKKAVATEYMYFYRTTTPNSLSKRYSQGLTETKRIVYHFNRVTEDMQYLVDEIREADKTAEVMLMTNRCDIPELSKYCRIYEPQPMRANELRGEPLPLVTIIKQPIITQVVFYNSLAFNIGGIETFNYNFVRQMSQYYDILVLYEEMDNTLIQTLEQFVRVEKNTGQAIICDTLILNRIFDKIPQNVTYKKSVQVIHGCKQISGNNGIPRDRDIVVPVSQTVADSWRSGMPKNHKVIHNLTFPEKTKDALILVSTTRLDTGEKGQSRMIRLANMLNEKKIPFIWIYFSNRELKCPLPNMVKMPPVKNVRDYVASATYLVQLSDSEAFCYSMVEALELGVPVITTPLPVLDEIGVKDGVNGHIVPYDMNFDVEKLLDVPEFEYKYDNKPIIEEWRELLGDTKPKHDYKPDDAYKWVEITTMYTDVFFNKLFNVGDVIRMPNHRANLVCEKGFGKIKEI